MIFSFRKLVERAKFAAVFIVFTYALYHMLLAVSHWIDPAERYKQPEGRAVKVFQEHVPLGDSVPMGERLKLFYWIGE
ncbi:YqzK family protein [Paenibacillus doosanensis]|uniref:DUF4227 domain-containing protein n=1 Tax=Paenibacillus konkukensis TaxID=2020716 RepID=A0ABY4RJG6_9BACL|nr:MULTISPECIES: DUF4227 family protein [Paenibacillus]MCS7461592.1 YqzK family protein [Paenibacillus doosanensis]UQZ82016.1 hypothetical protein SK3146_01173 [Paenibacillus konkukensis]